MVINGDKYSKKLELLLIFTNVIFCQYLSLNNYEYSKHSYYWWTNEIGGPVNNICKEYGQTTKI